MREGRRGPRAPIGWLLATSRSLTHGPMPPARAAPGPPVRWSTLHWCLMSPLSQGQLRLSLTGVGTSHCPLLIPLRGIIPSSLLQAAVRRPAKQFSFAGQFSLQLLMVLVSAMLHAAASTSKYSVFFNVNTVHYTR